MVPDYLIWVSSEWDFYVAISCHDEVDIEAQAPSRLQSLFCVSVLLKLLQYGADVSPRQ
jgi:hypothetical protein